MTAPEEPWTIGRLLQWTVEYLGKHGADNPRLDAEVLLATARGCKRIDLYTSFTEPASDEIRTAFRELVKRRAAGTPVAYLVGHREFYSLDFEVNSDVLIPRPETELLVVALLDRVKAKGAGGWGLVAGEEKKSFAEADLSTGEQIQHPASSIQHPKSPAPSSEPSVPLNIADVGTGSGILAVCAAKYIPTAQVTAIDVSPASLAVARRNAERHGVVDRITFVESNLFASVADGAMFDYIVSNPPYISTSEMGQLARDVREHEPHLALHAGEIGTDVIAPLIEQSAVRLKTGGALLIEISPMIVGDVETLIREQPALELAATIKDLAGHARAIQATRKKAE